MRRQHFQELPARRTSGQRRCTGAQDLHHRRQGAFSVVPGAGRREGHARRRYRGGDVSRQPYLQHGERHGARTPTCDRRAEAPRTRPLRHRSPGRSPIRRMRAAINLEAAFALLVLCVTGLSLSSAERSEASDRPKWLLLLLIIPAALLWTVTIPLVSDDFVHIGFALHFTPDNIVELFTIPAGDHFFRPLGYISYAVDARWAGHSPALWHLATLLIHFANCALVYVLARQTGLTYLFATT